MIQENYPSQFIRLRCVRISIIDFIVVQLVLEDQILSLDIFNKLVKCLTVLILK